jgi:hypothetical protein
VHIVPSVRNTPTRNATSTSNRAGECRACCLVPLSRRPRSPLLKERSSRVWRGRRRGCWRRRHPQVIKAKGRHETRRRGKSTARDGIAQCGAEEQRATTEAQRQRLDKASMAARRCRSAWHDTMLYSRGGELRQMDSAYFHALPTYSPPTLLAYPLHYPPSRYSSSLPRRRASQLHRQPNDARPSVAMHII